jgi:hypothetical protein
MFDDVTFLVFLLVWFGIMVLNATFNNISVISLRSFNWWRKPADPDKTTDLSQVTDKLYHIIINRYQYIFVGRDKSYFVKSHTKSDDRIFL